MQSNNTFGKKWNKIKKPFFFGKQLLGNMIGLLSVSPFLMSEEWIIPYFNLWQKSCVAFFRYESLRSTGMDSPLSLWRRTSHSLESGHPPLWHGLRRYPLRDGWSNLPRGTLLPGQSLTRVSRPAQTMSQGLLGQENHSGQNPIASVDDEGFLCGAEPGNSDGNVDDDLRGQRGNRRIEGLSRGQHGRGIVIVRRSLHASADARHVDAEENSPRRRNRRGKRPTATTTPPA